METAARTVTILPFSPSVANPVRSRNLDEMTRRRSGAIPNPRSIFFSVWENSRNGMRLTDEQGTIVYVNKAYCSLAGKNKEELEGKPFTIVYDRNVNFDQLNRTYQEQFTRGKSEVRLDRELALWSGKSLRVEIVHSFVESDDGSLLMLSEFVDITERKRAEHILRESEAKYRGLFCNSIQAMFQSSVDGKILNANRALLKLLGYDSFEELAGLDIARDVYVEAGDRNDLKQILNTKGYVSNVELTLKRKNGKNITVLEHSRVLKDEHGNIVMYEGILEDITARKVTEEKLQRYVDALESSKKELFELNAQKDKLFSILSHDLRSPFGSILGFCDILLKEGDQLSPKEQKEFLGYIEESAQDQLALVNKLLEWSRLESGRIHMEIKEVDVSEIAEKSIHSLLGIAKQKSVALCSLLPKNLVVRGDEQLLQQVFANLLGNSLKFTPDNGSVTVELVEQTKEQWTIGVRDTGIGIPEGDLRKLFKVEEKYTRSGLHGEKGTGLGLPVVNEIVQKHGGSIRVDSTVGRGTTFLVTLPNSRPIQATNILIVDDEQGVRVLHTRYMKRLMPGVNILHASNGQEAFEIALQFRPKFILSDYDMPVVDGFELLSKLKSEPATKDIPVLVITGVDSNGSGEALRRSGAAVVLRKPVSPEQLQEAIKKIEPEEKA